MTFPQSVRHCLRQFATFTGRATRPEFWWFALFLLLANLAGNALDLAILGTRAALFGPLVALALFVPYLAAGVRRLHDRDMSGWWMALMLLPVIGGVILLVILAMPGARSENRFGPRPA